MSSFIPYADFDTNKENSNQFPIARSITLLLIGIFAALIIGWIVWQYSVIPNLKIKSIDIHSNNDVSELDKSRIQAIIGVKEGSLYYQIDSNAIEVRLLETLPLERVVVKKSFPSSLKITIRERTPLLIATYQYASGESIFVNFDGSGYLVEVGSGIERYDLPILSGDIVVPEPSIGSKIGDTYLQLLSRIHTISLQNPDLYQLISEIELQSRSKENYDVYIYFRNSQFPCLFSQNITEESLENALIIEKSVVSAGVTKRGHVIDCRNEHRAIYSRNEKEDGNA